MFTGLKLFVESSALTRLLANLFIFLILSGSGFIAIWQILHNEPVNPYCIALLSSGLTYGSTMLGVHLGAVTSTNAPVPSPVKEVQP